MTAMDMGAIVFLTEDADPSRLFFSHILFDPAILWLSETLRHSGVERFLVVCDNDRQASAAAFFPADTDFVVAGSPEAPTRMAEFLSQVPGSVTVVTRPVLLAPQGAAFSLPGKEPPKSVFTVFWGLNSSMSSGTFCPHVI